MLILQDVFPVQGNSGRAMRPYMDVHGRVMLKRKVVISCLQPGVGICTAFVACMSTVLMVGK
jgi:hypothetical protein